VRVCHVKSAHFDGPNLVSTAGLVPVMALAQQAGLCSNCSNATTMRPTRSGVGVKEFFIRRTALGKGRVQHVRKDARGIWIRRFDGSEEDWSYTSAIDQEGRQSDVKEALRAVADEQRVRFREQAFASGPVFCARTGEPISALEDAEVRYEQPSWGQLTVGFVATQGGWDAIELTAGDGQVQIAGDLADDRQRQAWTAYWEQHACPVLVKKPGA